MELRDVVIDPSIPCRNRAAGHDSIRQAGPFVCKYINPLSDTGSGYNEIRFYETQLAQIPSIHPFVPKYRGTKKIMVDDEERLYLILDDLTYGFKKPSVIDIKMGTRLVAENATPRQIERTKIKKFAGQEFLGFRMSGARTYRNDSQTFVTPPDKFFRSVVPETIAQTFVDYYLYDGIVVHYEIAERILPQLQQLLESVKKNRKFRISLSSLLIIYEADQGSQTRVDVKMIDFGHVHEQITEGQDVGYITGVTNLIRYMTEIIEKRPTPSNNICQIICE